MRCVQRRRSDAIAAATRCVEPSTSSASWRASRCAARGRATRRAARHAWRVLPALAATIAPLDAPLLRDCAQRSRAAIRNGMRCSRARSHAEPAALLRDGGVIADGYDAELDELRGIDADCGEFLLDLERASASAPASRT